MVQHGAGADGGPPCYNTIPIYCGGSTEIKTVPHPGIISSLRTCLFGCETNHNLVTEAPVHINKKKSAAEVTLYWWVSTGLEN